MHNNETPVIESDAFLPEVLEDLSCSRHPTNNQTVFTSIMSFDIQHPRHK